MERTLQERLAIIKKAIKETENVSGQKWSVDKDGTLKWDYLTVEYFRIEAGNTIDICTGRETEDEKYVKVVYVNPLLGEETFVYVLVGNDFYCDAQTVEQAIEIAVKATIRKANRTF